MKSQPISDIYLDGEFSRLLDLAETNADGSWEEDFIQDMEDRFGKFGSRMLLSAKQQEILERISER